MSGKTYENHLDKLAIVQAAMAEQGYKNQAKNLSQTTRALVANAQTMDIIKNKEGPLGRTPLMYAAKTGDLAKLQFLLSKNANITKKTSADEDIMHMAAIGGNAHIIRLLHSRGVTLNSRGHNEETPLMYACFFKKVEAVRALCELGADVNAEDSHGKTALFFTVYDGTPENLPAKLKYLGVFTQENRDIIHELLRRGANINKQTLSGMTVLMVAAQESPDSIRFLLENGADPNIIDNNFYSPLDYACSYEIEANVRVLAEVSNLNLQVGPTRETTLMTQAKINSTFVQILCQTGRANLELKNSQGDTALQCAAGEGSVQAVSILCEAGADVNTRDNQDSTPLINTVLSLQDANAKPLGLVKQIIRTLLEHGADPTLTDNKGRTFIDCAAEDIQEEIQAIVDSVHSNINSFAAAGGASRKRKAKKTRKAKRKTRKARS